VTYISQKLQTHSVGGTTTESTQPGPKLDDEVFMNIITINVHKENAFADIKTVKIHLHYDFLVRHYKKLIITQIIP